MSKMDKLLLDEAKNKDSPTPTTQVKKRPMSKCERLAKLDQARDAAKQREGERKQKAADRAAEREAAQAEREEAKRKREEARETHLEAKKQRIELREARAAEKERKKALPKPAQSSFFLYCAEQRPLMKEENPTASTAELVQVCMCHAPHAGDS